MKYSVIDILEELESTAGSLAKREILDSHSDNDLLKAAFIAAGDPYVVYYVNKFKMPVARPRGVQTDDKTMEDFLSDLLPSLSSREYTGNAAKGEVIAHFEDMDERQQKWCQRIILKNMRCGVQTTVNKVWPGAIKSFSVALAETLKSEFIEGKGIHILEPVNYPVRVEPKLDGLRCIAIKRNGNVTFYTRNGTELETLPTIREVLFDMKVDNIVLDGEALGDDWNESASILMSKKTKKDDSNIVFNIFDALPLSDWVSQKTKIPYVERVELVKNVVDACKNKLVKQVPHIMAKSEKELLMYFQKCMDEGFEGVMLKTLDSSYKFKRSDNILKLKPCVTFEGVVVGHYEGRRGTKREGLFGGFEIVLPNGIITRLGGGFNDKLKADVQLQGPDSFIGKIVEIEGQPDPLTLDGLTKDGKVRFPVFTRFRDSSDVDPKVIAAGKKFLKAK
jgi:DNA ligase-1